MIEDVVCWVDLRKKKLSCLLGMGSGMDDNAARFSRCVAYQMEQLVKADGLSAYCSDSQAGWLKNLFTMK